MESFLTFSSRCLKNTIVRIKIKKYFKVLYILFYVSEAYS